MITIIKPGKKQVFKMECKSCFAEFTYELEDLEHSTDIVDNKSRSIICCPCCGAKLEHELNSGHEWVKVSEWASRKEGPKTNKVFVPPYNIPYFDGPLQTLSEQMDCSRCPYANSLKTGDKVIIGDTPCTWCKNRQFMCTSDSSNMSNNIYAYNNSKTSGTPIKDFMLHGEIKGVNNDSSTTISNG